MPGAKLSPGTHRVAAGQLLDECDCRGLRIGDAMVFAKHANIIVNAGRATAGDVLALAAEMKRQVRIWPSAVRRIRSQWPQNGLVTDAIKPTWPPPSR